MALAFTEIPDSQDVMGKTRVKFYDVTLETSYVGGGTTITPANVGLRTIFGARIIGGNTTAKSLQYYLDTTTTPGSVKLLCLFPTGGATTSPTALADPKSTTGASTASAVNATTPDITPGQGKEVAATADLHAGVVRIEFIGN